ncbi:MAG TPA: alpha/beta fold hydrolase, partial [Alphaproteobacteria bacterium]|nr:alpha/beta fold hydrolase [Alphaproteobacteria bacterium]
LVVLIEDAHWIDQATQGFLDGLVSTIPSLRVLLVVTYRPEYRHQWANRPNYAQCRIEPLPAESAIELLDSLLGAGPHLDGIKRSIADRSGGNPFFIEEIVRSLDETGVLSRPPGERANFDEVAIAVPPTVQDVLAGRVDRLTAEAKRVLQAAAAIGRNVPYVLLHAVTESDDERLAAALAALEAADFVHESRVFPERELTFKHALTRQVAYGAMTNAQRRAMHLKIAAAMLQTAADRVSEDVESLAAHYAEGESWPQAVDYLLRAARKAKLQYAYDAALAFSRRARAAAAAGDDLAKRQVEAAIAEGDLLSLLGQLEPANASYDAALALETDAMQRRRIANRRHEARPIVRDGGRVVYYEHGGGEETLVFVHPFVYGLSTFQPIVEQLCQEFRVVTIDPRGTGASDPLPPDYDIGDHMLDVAAVIEALPVESVTAIGLSRGANLLIRLAVARPTLLRRLILVGAHTRQTVGIGVDPEGNMSMTHDTLDEFVAALLRGDIRQAATIFAAKIFSEAGTDELRRQFIQRCVDLPPETVVRFFTFDPKADVENLLDKVDTPTLVMHGSRDDDVSLVTGIEIAQRIAKADLYVFEGKGHLPMFTATGEFCTTLRNFVRQGRARVPLAI